ncbi:MAG TPA: DUF952 domain-containing protein [Phototrophicaceae bacterium]|nr:DUF952 domain-containing protein [Phototrophicaceae bacterium]
MIYHIAQQQDWQTALNQGVYRIGSLESEGFIHCSKPEQVVKVANAIFRGQVGLVLLVIDPERLTMPLKYEPPVHVTSDQPATTTDERFPHLYGPLNLEAVLRVLEFPPAEDGTFTLVDAG